MFIQVADDIEDFVPEDVNEIIGPKSIKPLESVYYRLKMNDTEMNWSISLPADKNKEIDDVLEYTIVGNRLKITWTSMISGSFIIHCGDLSKTILVESLF